MSLEDGKVNILLVDDQPEGLVALDAMLDSLGQRLVRANSGREALRHLLQEEFALVLLDVVMPVMDGFETAKLIRERPKTRDVPIIFLTGLSRGELPTFQAYALGAVDYILKPIEPEILRSKVAVFVDLARKAALIRQQAEALREGQRREHELQLAEVARRAEAERLASLEAVLNASQAALVVLERGTGRALFANGAATTLPWKGGELGGEPIELLDRNGTPLKESEHPAQRAAAGDNLSAYYTRWRTGSREGAFLAYSEALPHAWGHESSVLLTLFDVSELARTQTQLQLAVEVRDTFLSVASHELKTPLTALGLQVQRLLRAQKRGENIVAAPGREPTALLERSLGRMNKLVSDLLDVSRISAGKLEMQPVEVDLSELVRDVANQMKEEFANAGCALTLNLPAGAMGSWDRSRLEQVVTNLAANAAKYAAGKPVEITVGLDGDDAVLSVKDNGIGIAQEDQPRIFRRFERAASVREYGGLGLGLWIVRQIVDGLGGQISVTSELGSGATFTVRLPRAQAAVAAAPAGDAAAA